LCGYEDMGAWLHPWCTEADDLLHSMTNKKMVTEHWLLVAGAGSVELHRARHLVLIHVPLFTNGYQLKSVEDVTTLSNGSIS
jgi:hypothetical protein